MFALLTLKPRFKSFNFYQNIPKIKLLLQKNAKFFCAGGSAPRPPCLQRRLGVLPQDPQNILRGEFLAKRRVFLLLLCYFV